MGTRAEFALELAKLPLSHTERAIAFLWFYRQTQQFEERTAFELASDLHEEKFPKPRVSRLKSELSSSKYTTRGKMKDSFQLDVRKLKELDDKYGPLAKVKVTRVTDSIIPQEWVSGKRAYLERLVTQINGTYDYAFYDACAALCRRLMESLIIEVYVSSRRTADIQVGSSFFSLDRLIAKISGDTAITLGRNTPKTMQAIKELGDTAAHDRTYITLQQDVDENKLKYRKMIRELLDLAGIS